jgi:release factor glutamine methyltransferase
MPRVDKAPRTIRELTHASRPWLEKKGVDNARLDTELLIAHALGMQRLDLYLDWDRPLTNDEIARCRELIRRRGAREPVSLITGAREFGRLSFLVTKDTLAPRPETELLLEHVLNNVPADATGVFADACTGTGCIAVTVLHERPGLRAVATDLSPAALDVAAENARRHGVDGRLELCCGDLLAGCPGGLSFVVANPPYIKMSERASLAPEVREHEPALALFGEDDDALGHHRRILGQARALVVDGGFCALEIGAAQGALARAIVADGWCCELTLPDLAGLSRVVVWRRC